MFKLYQLYIINLILNLNVMELVDTTAISDYSKDSSTNIKLLYDDDEVNANTNNVYKTTDQHNFQLSNQSHVDKSPVIASEIEHIASYGVASVNWENDKLLQNMLLTIKREREENICLLDTVKIALKWWSHTNGTLRRSNLKVLNQTQQLDLSYRHITSDEQILVTIISNITQDMQKLVALSLANNNLKSAPFQTLQLMSKNLKYLSLMGNQLIDAKPKNKKYNCSLKKEVFKKIKKKFIIKTYAYDDDGETLQWATFPYMPSLLALDISNCSIEFINKQAFTNLTNLKSLYMSSNKMISIPSDTFYHTPLLQVLDLSLAYDDFEFLIKFNYGVNIEQDVFRHLPNLVYLNLSHTKLSRGSAIAFTGLGPHLKYLSLCYTSFPVFSSAIFQNSPIVGLDLSGNVDAINSLSEDVFEKLAESLSFMIFEKSNLRDLSWLKPLHSLRLLALAGNNINTLSLEHFSNLKQLHTLDLTSNQVGNWYSRVFVHNEKLNVLSLSNNNINVITPEMLKDFNMVPYMSLGNNDFICDCLLHDLVVRAAKNYQKLQCEGNFLQDFFPINSTEVEQFWHHTKLLFNSSLNGLDIPSLLAFQNLQKLKRVVKKLARQGQHIKIEPKIRFIANGFRNYNATKPCSLADKSAHASSGGVKNELPLEMQLLDYAEEQYWCYNETKRLNVIALNCQEGLWIEIIEQVLITLPTYITVSFASFILVVILAAFIYFKRWHIYYYYAHLKSATLLSVVSSDNKKKFNSAKVQNSHLIYDLFVSYCQSDRDWIVQEFMPNVEASCDISICLHERDFEIGVTILDNIMSCMERSKTLMLIISSNFLLSHWCQFELQLAQYQMFDLSKEHLILILLEDIPRRKRPKNLQYLMDVKTYIKWPVGKGNKQDVHPEERKLFWKRLNRILKNIDFTSAEFQA